VLVVLRERGIVIGDAGVHGRTGGKSHEPHPLTPPPCNASPP
jgi:hypothetical protein